MSVLSAILTNILFTPIVSQVLISYEYCLTLKHELPYRLWKRYFCNANSIIFLSIRVTMLVNMLNLVMPATAQVRK